MSDNQAIERAVIDREIALLRMENESIAAMSMQRPRDHVAIVAEIKKQLIAFRSFAEGAKYCKPVGRVETCPSCGWETHYQERCRNRECGRLIPQKFARGLSIRAAEALAAAYKYNRVSATVTDLDHDRVRIDAMFIDYQDGRMWMDSAIVSKVARRRDGSSYRVPDERFYAVVVQARKSILIRECITRMIPPAMRLELERCIDEAASSFLDEAAQSRIVNSFATLGVAKDQLESLIGRPIGEFTIEDRKTLAGIWTDITEGGASVDTYFARDGGAQEATEAGMRTLRKKVAKVATTETKERETETATAEAAPIAAPDQDMPAAGPATSPADEIEEVSLAEAATLPAGQVFRVRANVKSLRQTSMSLSAGPIVLSRIYFQPLARPPEWVAPDVPVIAVLMVMPDKSLELKAIIKDED